MTVGHSGWEWGSPSPQGQTIEALEFEGARGYAAGEFGTLLRTDDGGDDLARLGDRPHGAARAHRPDRRGLARRRRRLRACAAPTTAARPSRGCPGPPPTCAARRRSRRSTSPPTRPATSCSRTDRCSSTADGGRTWSRKTAVPGRVRSAARSSPPTSRSLTADTGVAATTAGRDLPHDRRRRARGRLVHDGSAALHGVHFVSPLVGLRGRRRRGTCCSTADGGLTWLPKAADRPVEAAQRSAAPTPLTCLITTEAASRCCARSTAARPTRRSAPSTQKILAAAFSSPTRAVAAGEDGTTVLSDDAGATWRPVGRAPDATSSRGCARVSSSLVFAAGPSGALARSDRRRRHLVRGRRVHVRGRDRRLVRGRAHRVRARRRRDAAAHRQRRRSHGRSSTRAPRPARRPCWRSATETVLLVGPKGVLRSTDGGESFTRVRGRLLNRSKLFNVDRGGSVRVRLRLEEHPRLHHRRAARGRRCGCRARR